MIPLSFLSYPLVPKTPGIHSPTSNRMMKNSRLCCVALAACLLLSASVLRAELRVTSVQATPFFPWNGKVAITVQLEGTPAGGGNVLVLEAYDKAQDRLLPLVSLTGQREDFSAPGTYTLFWDAATDCPEYFSPDCQIAARLFDYASATTTYLVIDLSGGPEATSYPCRYTNSAPNISGTACRTKELWLRRILGGTFLMGSPEDERGRYDDETQHQVTLTQGYYYIGVFEVTQRQYELVMGSNPSYRQGDTHPVETVSYDDLRGTSAEGGAGWPAKGHAVDATSFFGVLRAKTGLCFDLPTEAQWEYACRAGTTTALNSGKNLTDEFECPNLAVVGRYDYNRDDGRGGYSEHTRVGSYLPNAWGLYDMHGNVWEWCLDWYGNYPSSSAIDPAGADSGLDRVLRGGGWEIYAGCCRSANRDGRAPLNRLIYFGFRLVCLP